MQISLEQKFNPASRCGSFVIDEIFLCDNKKELLNAPQQKKIVPNYEANDEREKR